MRPRSRPRCRVRFRGQQNPGAWHSALAATRGVSRRSPNTGVSRNFPELMFAAAAQRFAQYRTGRRTRVACGRVDCRRHGVVAKPIAAPQKRHVRNRPNARHAAARRRRWRRREIVSHDRDSSDSGARPGPRIAELLVESQFSFTTSGQSSGDPASEARLQVASDPETAYELALFRRGLRSWLRLFEVP